MSFFSLSRCVDLVKSPFSSLGESLCLDLAGKALSDGHFPY